VEELVPDRQGCHPKALALVAEELTADLRVFLVDRVPAASVVLACHLCHPADRVEMQVLGLLQGSAVVQLKRPASKRKSLSPLTKASKNSNSPPAGKLPTTDLSSFPRMANLCMSLPCKM
jgi:hypothetical protein